MRILIADDHVIVREGLKHILLKGFPFAFIDEVADAEELTKKAIHEKWDVIISDLTMPGRSGIDALQQIKGFNPNLPVLILTMQPEEHYAIRAFKAGAAGYLSKDSAGDELIKAIRVVLSGKKYITPSIAEQMADFVEQDHKKELHENLSDREFEILKLLARGESVSEIAARLSLGATTISTYRSRILIKMNMKNNADLTRYVLEKNLL